MEYILGIDAGTTGIRIFCFDKQGQVISSAYEEFEQIFPKPGWVEHNPIEIWEKTEKLLAEAIQKGGLDPKNAKSIGITNQRETTVVFEKNTGKPIYNAIVWQCRRTSGICQDIKDKNLEPEFRNKTGLVVDAYFSGTKIKWILDNVSGSRERAAKGEVVFGTIDTWLLYKLTGGHSFKTDYTNASRTLIYNIKDKCWDDNLLKILNIPKQMLPEVHPSKYEFGKTSNLKGIPDGIPINSLVGDQQGALFGQLCVEPGEAKNTYGTGCFLLCIIGKEFKISNHGLITTLGCDKNGEPVYTFEGSIFIAGAVIQWLRDYMKFFDKSAKSEEIANSLTKEDDVVVVPAFSGLGAPHWDMDARGAIYGITRDTSQEQITRAALKSIALQSYDLVKAMENDTGKKIEVLKVDGGATYNNYLMQYQSDILGIKVIRPSNLDTTVLGAAYLAGLQCGFFSSIEELKKIKTQFAEFNPKLDESKRNGELAKWNDAIQRTKSKR
ncbi:MAG: glycerol kinase GlpK [Leptospiraceae bacterium]|nr:glycerol kinase GlpK [Leptospiraceae bacterium]